MTTQTEAPPETACRNHPDQPGAVRLADGTWRCDPCHQEPIVTAWSTAHAEYPCPSGCGECIRKGDPVAVLDTVPPQRVCEGCVE